MIARFLYTKKQGLALLCLLVTFSAFIQVQEQAIASKVLKAINQIDSFQATFIYRYITSAEEPSAQQQEEIQGKIWIKGAKYRLILDEQALISNGQLVWSYLPEANEVYISYYDPTQEAFNPVKLLTMYRTGFLPIAVKTQLIGDQDCYVVELISQNPANFITRIHLSVGKKDKQPKNLKALDTNNQWHNFLITHFEPQVDLADTLFEFDITGYQTIEVIDLR